jgi:apolipoprotein N-acyltransferase
VLLATASAAVAQLAMPSSRSARARRSARGVAVAIGAVVAYGAVRLQQSFLSGPPITVGLVQGATPRAARWRPETAAANPDRYVQLSGRLDGASVVLWPEFANEAYPDLDAAVRRRVARVA